MSKHGFTLSEPVDNKFSMTLSAFLFIHVPTAFLKLNNGFRMYTNRI